MNLSDIAAIGSLVSGIAVLVSLIYLSQQIRQSTKHSRALIQQGRAARISETALHIADLRADDGIEKCFQGDIDVDAKAVGRFMNICRSIFISAEDSFFQRKEGLLDDMAFASFEASIRSGMGSAGVRAGWLLTRDMYEPEFRAYVDHALGSMAPAGNAGGRSLEGWKSAVAAFQSGAELPERYRAQK